MADPIVEYTSREMLAVLRQKPKNTDFLSALLVDARITHKTKNLTMDIVGGDRMSATYVNRHGDSHKIGRDGNDSRSFIAPYTYEEFEYGPSDLDERLPGQTEWDVEPATNDAVFMDDTLEKLGTRLDVLEERQLAEAIQTGIVTVSGKGTSYIVDYGMLTTHKVALTSTDQWDEANSTKMADLRTWSRLCKVDSGRQPNILLADNSAMDLLLDDSDILAKLDNRRSDYGFISPIYDPEMMASFCGRLNGIGFTLDLWTYDGLYDYLDESGDKQTANYMDLNRVVLLNPSMSLDFHYGKIENFNAPEFRGMRFPSIVTDGNRGKSKSIMVESSPLAGFVQPDAVVSAKVVVDD